MSVIEIYKSGNQTTTGQCPSGGGGGGNPKLVAGADPTDQALASATTSSNAITFNAPTGGSGSSTPSVALAHVNGSGATLSGSGLGPYTVNNLEDGDIVHVICTHTDDDGADDQAVTNVCVVGVAAAAAPSYTTETEIDFTSDITDSTGNTTGGAYTVYEADGTTPKATVDFSVSGGGRTINWDSTDGFYITGASAQAAIDLDLSGIPNPENSIVLVNAIFHIKTGAAGVGTIQIGDANTVTSGQQYGMRVDLGATNMTQATREYSGAAISGSNQNSLAYATEKYLAVQIQLLGNRPPRVVWSVDSSPQSYLADLIERDGVTYFGVEPSYVSQSAATTAAKAFDFSTGLFITVSQSAASMVFGVDKVQVKYKALT